MVPDETVCLWGGNTSGSSLSIQSERYLLYNTGSEILPAVLTVTVYEGEVPGSKIYMTEIMYNPTKTGDDYEWIEIYNPNPTAIYIASWQISDFVDDDAIIADNDDDLILLPAKNMVIINMSFQWKIQL